MVRIKVNRPIALTLGPTDNLFDAISGKNTREMKPGIHEVSEAELGHWFIQALIADGAVEVLAEPASEPEAVDAEVIEEAAPEEKPEPEAKPKKGKG